MLGWQQQDKLSSSYHEDMSFLWPTSRLWLVCSVVCAPAVFPLHLRMSIMSDPRLLAEKMESFPILAVDVMPYFMPRPAC